MNRYNCKMCDRFIVATGVTFAAGVLTVALPADTYDDGCRYCIFINSEIPATATRGAPVVFTIGDGTETYPFVDCGGAQVTQESIGERYRYAVRVRTTATGGSFVWLGRGVCFPVARLPFIDGTAPAAAGGDGA